MRINKKLFVEVADFDFHPSLTSSQSEASIRFTRVVQTLKLIFSRDRDEGSTANPETTETPLTPETPETPEQCKSFPQLGDSVPSKELTDSL
uniref:Uncharacterized protein n=1 Tax=Arion vulgaris TaxID=1028688 RepID=A0A0B6ZIH2_9EUPU